MSVKENSIKLYGERGAIHDINGNVRKFKNYRLTFETNETTFTCMQFSKKMEKNNNIQFRMAFSVVDKGNGNERTFSIFVCIHTSPKYAAVYKCNFR